jgi:dTMP kinase
MRIAIEGGEGVGKSTLIGLIQTLYPNAVVAAEGKIPNKEAVYAKTPLLQTYAFAQDRARLNHTVYLPNKNRLVVTDRSVVSNIIYQGGGRLGVDGILYLNRVVDPDFSLPDHVIILDSDPAFNLERLEITGRELDSNDLKSLEHHEAIRQGYLKFAQTGLVPVTVIRDIHQMDTSAVAQILDRIIGIHGHL